MVACDIYRPAAIEQLKQLGKELNIEVYSEGKNDPVEISKNAIKYAKDNGYDYVLIDTAGRLQIDEKLMQELDNIVNAVNPEEILLVLDASTGQNAISQVKAFKETTGVTGLVLTKLDGTAKGGVVIGIVDENKIPIKYIGVGEQIDDMEVFNSEDFINAII